MRRILPGFILSGFAVAQEFTPNTEGFSGAVAGIFSFAVVVAAAAVALGVLWFLVDVWRRH